MGRSASVRVAEQRAHAVHQRRHCWFPEGFDMPDLQDVQVLLDEL